MRTVTFQSVLNGVAVRCGLDVTQTIPGNIAAAYTEYINRRLRQAQEAVVWPELTRCEQRQYRADWNSGTTYAVGAEVFNTADQTYYRAVLQNSNVQPPNVTYWQATPGDFLTNIDLDQAGLTPMGEVVSVNKNNPSFGYSTPVTYAITSDGLLIFPPAPVKVWVTFTLRPVSYTATSGDADFPYVLSEIVKSGAAADALREDGFVDKAAVHDAIARDLFESELDKLEFKQQQRPRWGSKGR